MAVINLWSGAVTQSRFKVVAKVDGISARLLVSNLENFALPMYFNCTIFNSVATGEAKNLQPNTSYFYRLEVDGEVDSSLTGKCKTAVRKGTPMALKMGAFSCAGGSQNNEQQYPGATPNISNSPHFLGLLNQGIELLLHTGDIHYRDYNTNNPDLFRQAFDDVLAEANQKALYSGVAIEYNWDDHDFGPNDSGASSASKPAAQLVYRERVPHPDLPSPTGEIYHSFVRGRLRFIASDSRSGKSPMNATNNDAKVVYTAEQEAWLFQELQTAKDLGQIVCWINTFPWIANPTNNIDHWGAFNNQRVRIANFIDSIGIGSQMFIVAGDMHALAIDDGRNNQWGGFPVFQFAAMDANGSSKGGPYWKGPSQGRSRYGVIDIVDDGFDISITGTGYISSAVWDSYTFTVPMPPKVQNRGNAVFPMTIGPEGWESANIRGAA